MKARIRKFGRHDVRKHRAVAMIFRPSRFVRKNKRTFGRGNIRNFRPICRYILETVQDRAVVIRLVNPCREERV